MDTSYNRHLSNLTQKNLPVLEVKYCNTFSSRLRGFMFTTEITQGQGLILAYSGESVVDSSIHMFFMNFDLSVFWLNKDLMIVDKVLAKRWKPYYASRIPAKYVLEAHSSLLNIFNLNDRLSIDHG